MNTGSAFPLLRLFCCTSLICLISGCGARSDLELSPVVGKVTLNGEPLPGAFVSFSPDGGRPSTGVTKEDGAYELVYTYNKKGALVGPHVVHITTEQTSDRGGGKEILPARYHTETELTAKVEPGRKNEIDFALTK